MKNESRFSGPLASLLQDFVQLKRSLGYKYETTSENLRRFSEFSMPYVVNTPSLTKALVLDWTERRKNEGVRTWEHRASDLRQFALYMQDKGYEVFIPPGKRKVSRGNFIPYIFTHDEITRLFRACDSMPAHCLSSKKEVFPILLRLLYSCGLRISEAIHLKKSDVDLLDGVVFIRASKFNQDRLIPLSERLWQMFADYDSRYNNNASPSDSFFRNKRGTPLSSDQVYKTFRTLLWKAGIPHGGKGKGPRLHDLRHTFCVHTLASQTKSGIDIYCALPVLSTYLGHTSVAATQHYLRLTVEAYPDLIRQVASTCAHIFPEVRVQ